MKEDLFASIDNENDSSDDELEWESEESDVEVAPKIELPKSKKKLPKLPKNKATESKNETSEPKPKKTEEIANNQPVVDPNYEEYVDEFDTSDEEVSGSVKPSAISLKN